LLSQRMSASLTRLRPGRFRLRRRRMKEVVNALGEPRRHLGHGSELPDRGFAHRLGRSQCLEQARTQRGAYPGNLVEHRADGAPGAELLVICDGEAMRLVADLLKRLQPGRPLFAYAGLVTLRP